MQARHQISYPDVLLPVEAYHLQSFSATACHQIFYPDGPLSGEALALPVNEALSNFLTSCEWTPDRGPCRSFSADRPATDATDASLGGSAGPMTSTAVPHVP